MSVVKLWKWKYKHQRYQQSDTRPINTINYGTKTPLWTVPQGRYYQLFKKGDLPLEKLKEDFETDPALSIETRGKLRTLRGHLFNFLIQQSEQEIRLSQILVELQSIKDRVLNPLSHGTPMPHYTQELKEAIEIVEQMHILLNPNPITT